MRLNRPLLSVCVLTALIGGCQTKPSEIMGENAGAGQEIPATPLSSLDEKLLEAAAEGDINRVQSLIDAGANVNARDDTGDTLLHIAANSGLKDMTLLLIARGADVNARGGPPGYTPLCAALGSGWSTPALAEEVMKTERPDLDYQDELYWELLHEYAGKLTVEIVQILVAHGADVNARDEGGGRPLSYALWPAPIEAVKVLLSKGADPEARDMEGVSVIEEAIWGGFTEAVTLFLASGADVNARDRYRQTLLHEACWQNDQEMAELLLTHGAAVNAKDKNGDTPAHVAAMNGYQQLLDLLVSWGADMRARNKQGLTSLDWIRSTAPQRMITLSADRSSPYSVIITDPLQVRSFLQHLSITFDHIWIPEEADIRRAEQTLRLALEDDKSAKTREPFGREHILRNLDQYNREYSGFLKGKAKYVFCNLGMNRFYGHPPDNRFTGRFYGGWGPIRIVISLDSERVVRIEGDGR
jgi:ankyrin repeat protein